MNIVTEVLELGPPWVTKNLHFLKKVSWDRRVYQKIFTFSSSVGSQQEYLIRGERQRRVAKHREQPKLYPLELYSSPVCRP